MAEQQAGLLQNGQNLSSAIKTREVSELHLRYFSPLCPPKTFKHKRCGWRRRSESNAFLTDYQPQYPDLLGSFNVVLKRLQALFVTTRLLPTFTRHTPAAHSVIEEIVEGFVED
jgi:hypothetical protein